MQEIKKIKLIRLNVGREIHRIPIYVMHNIQNNECLVTSMMR